MADITYENRGIMGVPLAEVFAVIINTDAEECELYGTIAVEDCNGTLHIYNQEREYPETIKHNGSLGLINEERAIFGYNRFRVHFNLKDKKNGDAIFISSLFDWNEAMGYDKCLSAKVEGEHGSAEVYYTVYNVAIEASIWVHFTKYENASSDSVNACGSIVARYKKRYDRPKSEVPKEYYEVTMFECTSYELEHKEVIPLDRSVVVLPALSSLSIVVDLKGCGDEEPLWSGEVEFFPNDIVGLSRSMDIKGKYGVLHVWALGFNYLDSLKHVKMWKEGMRFCGRMP